MEGRSRHRLIAALVLVALVAAGCDGGAGDDAAPPDDEGAAATPADLPEPRTEVAGTAWNGRIVVVGGLAATGDAVDFVDVWDPETNEWGRLPDYPLPIHHTAVVTYRDRVWVIGGYTIEGGAWVALDDVYSLGEGEDEWREEAPLPEPRGALAAAVGEDGGIESLIAGGGVGEGGMVFSSVLMFGAGQNGVSDRWLPITQGLSSEREHFAMTAVGYDFYAVAGRAGGMETNRDTVEVLHLTDPGAWEPAGVLHRSRGGIGAATVDGSPCVAGGETPEGTVAEVECFVDGAWTVVAELATPRHGLAVVALGGDLHVIGGGPEPGLTVSGAHEVFDLG